MRAQVIRSLELEYRLCVVRKTNENVLFSCLYFYVHRVNYLTQTQTQSPRRSDSSPMPDIFIFTHILFSYYASATKRSTFPLKKLPRILKFLIRVKKNTYLT